MSLKETLQHLFFSPVDSSFLKALGKERLATRQDKDLFLKHILEYKHKIVPLVASLSHVDDQILLLKIFYKLIPSPFVKKNKVFHPFTKDFNRIRVDNFEKEGKEFLVLINNTQSSVIGAVCDKIIFNGTREEAKHQYCFFNEGDIKIYAQHIYYVAYTSIEECVIRGGMFVILLKDKMFELKMQNMNAERLLKFITKKYVKCVMEEEHQNNDTVNLKTPKSVVRRKEVKEKINVCQSIQLNVRGNIDVSKTPNTEYFDKDSSFSYSKGTIIQNTETDNVFCSTKPSEDFSNAKLCSIKSVDSLFTGPTAVEDDNNLFDLFSFSLDKTKCDNTDSLSTHKDTIKNNTSTIPSFKKAFKSKYENEINKILTLKSQLLAEVSRIYLKEHERKLRRFVKALKTDKKSLKGVKLNNNCH